MPGQPKCWPEALDPLQYSTRISPTRQLNRITQQPEIMGSKARIRGMRVTVGMIVGQIGTGHSVEEILADLSVSGAR